VLIKQKNEASISQGFGFSFFDCITRKKAGIYYIIERVNILHIQS
jgi:hypothetical protein